MKWLLDGTEGPCKNGDCAISIGNGNQNDDLMLFAANGDGAMKWQLKKERMEGLVYLLRNGVNNNVSVKIAQSSCAPT